MLRLMKEKSEKFLARILSYGIFEVPLCVDVRPA